MNYAGRPIDRLTVRISQLPQASQVRSVEHGRLIPQFDDDTMIVELPLEIADMLLIDR